MLLFDPLTSPSQFADSGTVNTEPTVWSWPKGTTNFARPRPLEHEDQRKLGYLPSFQAGEALHASSEQVHKIFSVPKASHAVFDARY